MTNNQTPDKKFSLNDEMKRRKQAELEREIALRKQAKLQGTAPTRAAAPPKAPGVATKATNPTSSIRPIAPPPESKRTTLQDIAPDAVRIATRPFQNLTSRQKITLTGAGAAVLIAIVLVGSLLIAGNTSSGDQSVGTPTLVAQPLSNIDNVLARFREVGVPISELKPYDLVNSQVWHAKAASQFVVQRGAERGNFTLFGYDTAKQASDDVVAVLVQAKYKKWNIQNTSNITLISPPETPADLQNELISHFLQYLFAPYRPFWPTATPVPTGTPAPTITPTPGPTGTRTPIPTKTLKAATTQATSSK